MDRINLNDQTVEGMRHKTQADFLRAVSSGGVAGAARFDAVVRGIPRADQETLNVAGRLHGPAVKCFGLTWQWPLVIIGCHRTVLWPNL